MNYFANSAWNYIEKKIKKVQKGATAGRLLLVMVPVLPKDTTLVLAETFANKCLSDATLKLTLKIANIATDGWSAEELDKAKQHDWLAEGISLTHYRSNLPSVAGKINLIVLCGADRVTDTGSLSDFHRCDLDTVWQMEMKGSFQSWAKHKLKGIGLENIELAELLRRS